MSQALTIRHPARVVPLRPLLGWLVILTAILSIVFSQPKYPMMSLLVGLVGASFVLTLNSPAWLLMPLLIVELSSSNYILPGLGISLRLAAVLIASALLLVMFHRDSFFADPRLRRVLMPALLLILVATAGNLVFSDADYAIKYFRYQITQLLSLVIVASAIRERRDLPRLAGVALAMGFIAAVAAVWQHYDRNGAFYGAANAVFVVTLKGRSVGLSDHAVTLANQLAFVLVPVLGVLLCGRARLDRTRVLLAAAALTIFAGLYVSYTRSAVIAIAPGLLLMALFLRGRRRIVILSIVLGAWLLFELLRGSGLIGQRYYRDASNDVSAASHEALWNVSLAVALDNPIFGIGHEHFEQISLDYSHLVDPEVLESGGDLAIGEQRPHNDFMSVWIAWGIVALLAYIQLFIASLTNLYQAARSQDLLLRGLAVGCAGGVITYAVNSSFHNYMDSSTLLWIYAGASVALARLARRPNAATPPLGLAGRAAVRRR